MNNNKIWCEHIKYWHRKARKDVPTFVGLEDFPEASGWSYIYSNLVQTDKWNFCPVCGAKKPNLNKDKEEFKSSWNTTQTGY